MVLLAANAVKVSSLIVKSSGKTSFKKHPSASSATGVVKDNVYCASRCTVFVTYPVIVVGSKVIDASSIGWGAKVVASMANSVVTPMWAVLMSKR
jgi:hypothetical protein